MQCKGKLSLQLLKSIKQKILSLHSLNYLPSFFQFKKNSMHILGWYNEMKSQSVFFLFAEETKLSKRLINKYFDKQIFVPNLSPAPEYSPRQPSVTPRYSRSHKKKEPYSPHKHCQSDMIESTLGNSIAQSFTNIQCGLNTSCKIVTHRGVPSLPVALQPMKDPWFALTHPSVQISLELFLSMPELQVCLNIIKPSCRPTIMFYILLEIQPDN